MRGIILPKRESFFHLHAHSAFSYNDALPQVKDMVETVVGHGHKALALTDHGNMGGAVQLYTECKKKGILPFPGVEMYIKRDKTDKKAPRFHMGVVAFTSAGYEALVRLTTRSHTEDNFYHKPHIDFSDMAEWKDRGWTDGLLATTGCYFGLVQQTLVTQGVDAAKFVIMQLMRYFPHLYVELQHHNIDHGDEWNDTRICTAMYEIALALGLPVVLTQDSHYCHQEDKPVHETLKRLVAFGPDADDAVFPGDSFHLCDSRWIRDHHQDAHWKDSEDSFKALLDLHALSIPELDSYSYNIPKLVDEPLEVLMQLCHTKMVEWKLSEAHWERFREELEVIKDTGMAGYLLLVKEVTDWCQVRGVFTQARGSASGSIVCWLTGITQVDPLKYSLRYERFISRDRTKPPDIDLDVEDTKREELIAWLRSRFNVCQIGTWAEYSIKDKGDTEGRGSLLVAYKSRARKSGTSPEQIGMIKTVDDLPEGEKELLLTLSAKKPYKSCGTHAAGLVITTSKHEFDKLVPTMLIPSGDRNTVTQFEMDDVEKLGLVKLDVLGLRTLSLLRRIVELLGREVRDGLDFIPLNDARTFTTLRNGQTAGVFQLEGWTASNGCREMQVKSLKDIIVIQALYRPAVMKSGGKDSYIARRRKEEEVPELHPIIMNNLKETMGIPVFQEQVISILRELGFDPDELTAFLKAVKASNSDIGDARGVIAGYQELFARLADEKRMGPDDRIWLWGVIEGFAEYGFNRAHATAYGLTSYRLAFLKTYYPLEFATALLETSAGSPKEDEYKSAVREMGIRILRPDVNISGATYTIDRQRKAIRKGLVALKGIGENAAACLAENAPFESIEDLIARCPARPVTGGKDWAKKGVLTGVLKTLDEAGALESLKK